MDWGFGGRLRQPQNPQRNGSSAKSGNSWILEVLAWRQRPMKLGWGGWQALPGEFRSPGKRINRGFCRTSYDKIHDNISLKAIEERHACSTV